MGQIFGELKQKQAKTKFDGFKVTRMLVLKVMHNSQPLYNNSYLMK